MRYMLEGFKGLGHQVAHIIGINPTQIQTGVHFVPDHGAGYFARIKRKSVFGPAWVQGQQGITDNLLREVDRYGQNWPVIVEYDKPSLGGFTYRDFWVVVCNAVD